jgi:hypothetical protein
MLTVARLGPAAELGRLDGDGRAAEIAHFDLRVDLRLDNCGHKDEQAVSITKLAGDWLHG